MIEKDNYKTLPLTTGVYQFLDKEKKIIYVGKALSLKKRVSSYFAGRKHDSKTRSLVSQIAYVDFVVTPNEKDALILEHDLIKRYRPRFNILLKDNKYFPYIMISKEKWPRVSLVRRSFKQLKILSKTSWLYGPYPDVKGARSTLDFLYRHFGLRSCDNALFSNRSRGCMKHQIGHCTAPCVPEIAHSDYMQLIHLTKQFLTGKKTVLIDELVEHMSRASSEQKFEAAAHYRDLIQNLRSTQSQQTMRGGNESLDLYLVLETASQLAVGLVVLRDGIVSATYVDYFDITDWRSLPVWYSITSYIQKYIFVSDPADDDLVFSSDGDFIDALSSGSYAQSRMTKTRLKQWYEFLMSQITFKTISKKRDLPTDMFADLGIKGDTVWAVAIDISHNQGSFRVASCASWHMNSKSKDGMQLFKLADQNNDVDAMRQVSVRLARRWQKQGYAPDLIIIDGGKDQLNAVRESFESFLESAVIISLSKGPKRVWGDEVIFQMRKELLESIKVSKALKECLLHIRDLAHDHAIRFHRKRIEKSHSLTLLRSIDGIGPAKEKKLIEGFGGLKGLKRASVSQLVSIDGVNRELALRIYDALH